MVRPNGGFALPLVQAGTNSASLWWEKSRCCGVLSFPPLSLFIPKKTQSAKHQVMTIAKVTEQNIRNPVLCYLSEVRLSYTVSTALSHSEEHSAHPLAISSPGDIMECDVHVFLCQMQFLVKTWSHCGVV